MGRPPVAIGAHTRQVRKVPEPADNSFGGYEKDVGKPRRNDAEKVREALATLKPVSQMGSGTTLVTEVSTLARPRNRTEPTCEDVLKSLLDRDLRLVENRHRRKVLSTNLPLRAIPLTGVDLPVNVRRGIPCKRHAVLCRYKIRLVKIPGKNRSPGSALTRSEKPSRHLKFAPRNGGLLFAYLSGPT
jgi:hypothetical protein